MKKFQIENMIVFSGFHRTHGPVIYDEKAQRDVPDEGKVSLFISSKRKSILFDKVAVKKSLIKGDESLLLTHVKEYCRTATSNLEPQVEHDIDIDPIDTFHEEPDDFPFPEPDEPIEPTRRRRRRVPSLIDNPFAEIEEDKYPNEEEKKELQEQMLEDEDNAARAHEGGWYYSDNDDE